MNRVKSNFARSQLFLNAVAIAGLLALPGCQSPDRAVFVTNTNLGVGYDASTATGHVGYKRIEAYIGPAYPDTGAILPVAASLQSDMAFIGPSVSQLYATGDAALIATKKKATFETSERDAKWGGVKDRRLAIVGTSSHVGFVVQTNNLRMARVDFGYGRQEASMLPLRDGSKNGPDYYPSVLASINVKASANDAAIGGAGGLKLTQFIATGGAAEALAERPDVRSSFDLIAETAAKDAAVSAAKTLGLSEQEFSALKNSGKTTGELLEQRTGNVIQKLLGVAPGVNRPLTQDDQAKIQAAADKLSGDNKVQAAYLTTLPDVNAVRTRLKQKEGLISALDALP